MTRTSGSDRKFSTKQQKFLSQLAELAEAAGPNSFGWLLSEIKRAAESKTLNVSREQEQQIKRELYRREYEALRKRGFTNQRALEKVSKKHGVSKKTIERALKPGATSPVARDKVAPAPGIAPEAHAAWLRYNASRHPPVSFEAWTALQGKFNGAASIAAAKKKDKT
jgi:predicted DNA-binding protein (UPF0251 family)